jgi:Glycosyl hydrolases family 8
MKIRNLTKGLNSFINKNLYVIVTLIILTIINLWNFLNFPYYNTDEGIYTAQGWTTLYLGQLSVYTYWYDHAPGGSLLIGWFFKITENLYNFKDFAIGNGRILSEILLFVSNILFALIIKKKSGSIGVVIFGLLAFNFSKLNIYFHRFILLDNLMVFWFIVSLYLLLNFKLSNISVYFSGLILGISFWSKESALFYFLPMLLYVIWESDKKIKLFKGILFSSGFIFVVLMYPVLALLKTELIPAKDKVSLISTILFHSGRGSRKLFILPESEFGYNVREWLLIDPVNTFVLLATLLTPLIYKFLNIEKKYFWLVYFLHFMYFVFLARGGTVLIIYVIPFLFTGAWLLTLIFQNLILKLESKSKNICYISIIIFFLIFHGTLFNSDVLNYDANINHRKALEWVRENANTSDVIAIDQSWQDLNDPNNISKKVFTNSEWFFKFDLDPEFNKKLIDGKWQNIKYIVASSPVYDQLESSNLKILKTALNNSKIVKEFKPTGKFVVSHEDFFSVNGDWTTILRVNDNNKAINTIYNQYMDLNNGIKGKTFDTFTNFTYSIDQADSLYSSLIMNNKINFENNLNWTFGNMIREDFTLSRSYGLYNSQTKILDSSPNIEATIKYAYTLLKAGEKWNNTEFINLGKKIINSLWNNYLYTKENYSILLSNRVQSDEKNFIQLDSGNFSPLYLREFLKYDKNDWNKVIDTSYIILNQILDQYHLFPNTFNFDLLNLKVLKPNYNNSEIKSKIDIFSYQFLDFDLLLKSKQIYSDGNNFNLPIITAFDKNNFKSQDSTNLNNKINDRFLKTYKKYGLIPAKINPDNTTDNPNYSDSVATTSAMISLKKTNSEISDKLYRSNYSFRINTDYTFENPTNKDKLYTWSAFSFQENLF